jgi:hypothetical protein
MGIITEKHAFIYCPFLLKDVYHFHVPTLSRHRIGARAEPLTTLIDYGIDFNKVEILVTLDDVISG